MIPAEILKKVRLIEIKTRHIVNNIFGGEYHSAFKGMGMEFAEVREYYPGDDIRDGHESHATLSALPTKSEMGGAPPPRLGRFIVRGARASGCKEGSEAEAGKVSEIGDAAPE